MKVVHLLKTAIGASWALRQTSELIKLGVEVHLLLPDGPMVAKYKAAGVNVHLFDPSLMIKKPWLNFSKARALNALIDQIKPDIIHSHFVATTLLMRLALRKSPIARIFHVPGPLHLEHFFFRRVELALANKQDYWLASCLWTQNKYRQCGIQADRVGLAYYGVNESDFLSDESKSLNDLPLRTALNMSEDTFIIGMVAYFYKPKAYLGQKRGLKGHEDLIDAVAIVRQRYPNIKCVFVGGAWGNTDSYYQSVQTYAAQVAGNTCVFLGFRRDVPQLYSQFDLAVHPSHSENVGGAVESLYARIPTLTTNVGGFPDLITDGETGYLCPAKSPVQLAGKIIQAIEDLPQRTKIIEQGFKKVKSVMNVQDNAKQVYDFYQHILQKASKL